jgi:hypothetical protein
MMKLFTDPRIFNFVLMGLYICASARWFFAGDWGKGLYWISALLLVVCITFFMGAK